MATTAPSPEPTAIRPTRCQVCGGFARLTATVTLRDTVAEVWECRTCGHKAGRLRLGPDDPPWTIQYVRNRLAKLLTPRRPRRATAEVTR